MTGLKKRERKRKEKKRTKERKKWKDKLGVKIRQYEPLFWQYRLFPH